MKLCSKCGLEQPIENFYFSKAKIDGRQNYCKACSVERGTWYQRLRAYGLTKKAFEEMLKAQQGRCAICHESFGDESPNLDHCHVTGVNRQLLCSHCNRGLGHFRDQPSLLYCAAEYLVRHGEANATQED